MLQLHTLQIKTLRNFALAAILAAILMTNAHAQNVYVVDGAGHGQFIQIQPAVNAAVDGDIILIKPGSYGQFAIQNKAITVTADVYGGVLVNRGVKINNLASTRSVTIRGIKTLGGGSDYGLLGENNQGPIWVENCDLSGDVLNPSLLSGYSTVHSGAYLNNCASITFLDCNLVGGNFGLYPSANGGNGLDATNSEVVMYTCKSSGGKGGNGYEFGSYTDVNGGPGGHGAVVSGGSLIASGCKFMGGKGGNGKWNTQLDQKAPGGDGGHGLFLNTNYPGAFVVDCSFTGGAVGLNGGPWNGVQPKPGLPTKIQTGVIQYSYEVARSYSATSPVRETKKSLLSFDCKPGEIVSILYSSDQDVETWLPLFHGSLLLMPRESSVMQLGAVPTGTAEFTFTMPTLPPTIQGSVIYTQALFTDVYGLNLVIGPASAITILDSSY